MLAIPAGSSSQTQSLVIAAEDDAAPWSQPDGSGYANEVVISCLQSCRRRG